MKPYTYFKALVAAVALLATLNTQAANEGFRFEPQDNLPKYGKDSVNCVVNISLYREFYRQWRASNFESPVIKDIIGPWRWVFNNCPLASENTYVDGVRIMQYRIENAKSEAERNKLIDTLLMVYDQRAKYFPNHFRSGKPQVGAVLGRKGIDLFTYDQERYEEAYNILKQSVELDKDDTDGTVLIYYFRAAVKMARKGKVDTAYIVDTYDQVSEILDHNISRAIASNDEKWAENYRNFKNNIEASFEPFASCTDLVRVYGNKLQKQPNDVELLKKVTSLLDRRGCQGEQLYLDASIRLHRLQPSPESAFNIGRLMLRDEKFNQAIPYLEEATRSSDPERSHSAYKLLAEVYKAVRNFPRARQAALTALQINPSDGAPLITIGDCYALTAKDCGDNDFTSKVGFWAAVDKYNQARKVDPSQADVASRRIATYSVHFPTVNVIFFHGFEEGQSYTIDCWYKEETTIRASR
ncbi:MAG TPA: hypothetical protein PKE03_05110 [Bacteroidales bacterium]|nr:hypothetical protein [Bacteroidales bacterium]